TFDIRSTDTRLGGRGEFAIHINVDTLDTGVRQCPARDSKRALGGSARHGSIDIAYRNFRRHSTPAATGQRQRSKYGRPKQHPFCPTYHSEVSFMNPATRAKNSLLKAWSQCLHQFTFAPATLASKSSTFETADRRAAATSSTVGGTAMRLLEMHRSAS